MFIKFVKVSFAILFICLLIATLHFARLSYKSELRYAEQLCKSQVLSLEVIENKNKKEINCHVVSEDIFLLMKISPYSNKYMSCDQKISIMYPLKVDNCNIYNE